MSAAADLEVRSLPLPGEGPSMDLARIPAGAFMMGDVAGRSPEKDTRPAHDVLLDAYEMAIYPVTNAQFSWFSAQTGYVTTREEAGLDVPYWHHFDGEGWEQHPVICVNWMDAAAFAVWAGLRLPTEAEWEKAARGGLNGADYPWGDKNVQDHCNWRGASRKPNVRILNKSGWGLTPVGSYPANGYGIYDMSGNVWEWCADAYHPTYYENSPRYNPKGPARDVTGIDCPIVTWRNEDHLAVSHHAFRAIRGGSWENNTFGLRCCERISASAGSHNKGKVGGFRAAS
jgi:formylglycine-generating enzyme required for sulfatase activity